MMLISGLLKTPFCWFSEIKNLPNINTFEKVSIIPANSSLQYLSFCDLSIFVTKLKLRIQKVNPCSPNTDTEQKLLVSIGTGDTKNLQQKKLKYRKKAKSDWAGSVKITRNMLPAFFTIFYRPDAAKFEWKYFTEGSIRF